MYCMVFVDATVLQIRQYPPPPCRPPCGAAPRLKILTLTPPLNPPLPLEPPPLVPPSTPPSAFLVSFFRNCVDVRCFFRISWEASTFENYHY